MLALMWRLSEADHRAESTTMQVPQRFGHSLARILGKNGNNSQIDAKPTGATADTSRYEGGHGHMSLRLRAAIVQLDLHTLDGKEPSTCLSHA